MDAIDPEAPERGALVFGINEKLAREIVWENNEAVCGEESPEQRFERVRAWIVRNLISPAPGNGRSLKSPETPE